MPLPLFLPFFWLSHYYFWDNTDSISYLNHYKSYRDALWHGEFYPRWINRADIGLGTIAFYFRSPFVYNLTAIISAPFLLSYEYQFILGIYASQAFGAWAMYRWLRVRYDPKLSLIGAAIYTLVPYKLFLIYQHCNLAQLWAMAFLPLWFHAAEKVETRGGLLLYALAGALCCHSHILTFISAAPVAAIYALHQKQWQWKRLVMPMILTHMLMLALVACYVASTLTVAPWMHADTWGKDYFSSLNNLHHADDYFCSYIPLVACIFYGMRRHLKLKTSYFWCIVLAVFFIIATPLSYPLWRYVSIMNIFQFPFARLQPVMQVSTAILCVYIFAAGDRFFINRLVVVLIAYFLWLGVRVQLVYTYHTADEIPPAMQHIEIRDRMIPSRMSSELNLPIWTDLTQKYMIENYKQLETMPRVQVKEGKAAVEVTRERNGQMNLRAQVQSQQASLVVTQFYIPAWHATADGHPLEVRPSPHEGLVEIQLPEGEHEVQLAIAKSRLEEAGDTITLAALGVYLIYGAQSFARRRAHGQAAQ